MGWTQTYNITSKKEMREDLLRQCTWDNDRSKGDVIIHRTVGNHLWLAMQVYNKAECTTLRFVTLFLMAQSGGYWGYKDMDESMGPYFYDCPQSVIDAAGPTDHAFALEWRAKVAAYHERKQAKRHLLSDLKIGAVVELKGCTPSTFRVTSLKPFQGYAVATGAGPYKLIKSRVTSVTLPE